MRIPAKLFHPTEPDLRQVHLIQAELFDELAQDGFDIRPGDLGKTSPPAASTS
ncbi:hypothetical protein [Arthrobacter yangruifuii]|uniref:hypothetical protein n=1 Tax=Arthrobacter yangruifuii TaxID=2606616 RepID=UPI001FEEB210|nr:hypothetical protein [Arthrobacter yangruifuii]